MEDLKTALKNSNYELAEEICDRILQNNEFDINGLYYKAIINRKQENFVAAIDTHNTLINIMPSNAEYIAERGLTFHMMKDEKQALNDFNTAVELEPQNAYRFASRAFIKDFYGDHYGALEDYNKAIELDPEDAIALNNRGVIEEKIGRLEEAKKSFDQSDAITGIDKKIQEVREQSQSHQEQAKPPTSNKRPSTLSLFFTTLRSLVTSSAERRSFVKYLRGNK